MKYHLFHLNRIMKMIRIVSVILLKIFQKCPTLPTTILTTTMRMLMFKTILIMKMLKKFQMSHRVCIVNFPSKVVNKADEEPAHVDLVEL